ncbi:MAG TPA: SRPBCC domain-containing protein [Anaerolineales bacterium]|nr:SRPBCC domain-containing protein [Anaerolineales bacterium]
MAKTQTLTFKRTVNAKPTDVYRAFTNSTIMREWFCDAALADPHKGGRIYAWWNSGFYASGEYLSVTPDKKVVFSWNGRGEPAPTQVQVSIAEKKGGTVVTVSHNGAGSGKPWAKTIKEIGEGWEQSLENLQSTLEAGEDLRISRRPMLGITLSDFNTEVAKKLGVPVTEGIRLDGTLEGMGARAAGLQKDDVIVGMAGKKITGFPSLAGALQGRRAGDRVAVKFYRGKKLETVTMELSRRPLPPIPATAAELSEAVRKMYAELDVELEKCLEGVTEAEASFKPAPDEWSAKDVVCHLLAGERDGHGFVAETIMGVMRYYDGFGENVEARHKALMAVFPTYRALLDEYKRAEAETVALLAAIPPEVAARKSSWWQLCYNTLQPPIHTQRHFEQIRAAIAAARKK